PAPLGHGAAGLRRRPQGIQREDPRGDPDGLARRVPEPMTAAWAGARLPGHDLVGFEDELEQLRVRGIALEAADRHTGRQSDAGAARQDNDRDTVAGEHVAVEHRARQGRVGSLHEMQYRGHQNTRKRRPRWTRAAISSRVTGMTVCPSAFQVGSAGTASFSTWNGTPSDLRFARN